MESNLIRAVVHYGLHFLAPLLLALLFKRGHRAKAYWVMVCTMLVDLDHLFANPVFDPHRMSVGFHPLHSTLALVDKGYWHRSDYPHVDRLAGLCALGTLKRKTLQFIHFYRYLCIFNEKF